MLSTVFLFPPAHLTAAVSFHRSRSLLWVRNSQNVTSSSISLAKLCFVFDLLASNVRFSTRSLCRVIFHFHLGDTKVPLELSPKQYTYISLQGKIPAQIDPSDINLLLDGVVELELKDSLKLFLKIFMKFENSQMLTNRVPIFRNTPQEMSSLHKFAADIQISFFLK